MATKKVLSIEIGYALTKVLEIDYKAKNPKVYSSFVLDTPSDFFTDDIITDHPEFSETFRKKLEELNIKTRNCVFTVTSGKIATREVPVPSAVKDNRIQTLIDMNARDYFPIDLSSYTLTYSVLRDNVKEGLELKKYLLVLAAPKDLLESYINFGTSCGLETIALDYNGNSLYEAVKDSLQTEELKMFIKVDEKYSYCMIVKGKDVVFTRNLAYGIDDAIEEIIDRKTFEGVNTYLSAMDLARGESIIYESFNYDNNNDSDTKARREAKKAVTDSFKTFVNGVARIIDIYKSKNVEEDISAIYLTGIGADFSGLQKLVAAETGYDCKVYTHFDLIRFDKTAKELSLGEYITCVGAALKPVGFVQAESKESTVSLKSSDYSAAAVLFFLLCIVASLTLMLMVLIPYKDAQKDKAIYEKRIENYKPSYDTYTDYLSTDYTKLKLEYFETLTDSNMNHIVEFIEDLEKCIPKSTIIQSFAATNAGVSMSVTVDSKAASAALIDNIKNLDEVGSVTVSSVSITVNELGEECVAFSMSIDFKSEHAFSKEEE